MLAISSKTIWALMSSVIVWILPLVCDAKPERLSKSHPLADPLTVDRFLKERIVVDGGMVAQAWLGCCAPKPRCSAPTGWARPDCHQYSPLQGTASLLRTIGANVSVVDVHRVHHERHRESLPSPRLTSNQLDAQGTARQHFHLYAESLAIDVVNDRKRLAAWTKTRHLAGVRLIRLLNRQSNEEDTASSVVSQRGIHFLLDRHFLLDVGALDRANRLAIAVWAQERHKPIIHSAAFLSSNDPCAQTGAADEVSVEEICVIANTGGLLVLGPRRSLVSESTHSCSTQDAVDRYLIDQVTKLSQIRCTEGKAEQSVTSHLGLASNLPVLPDPKYVSKRSGREESRWRRFAARFISAGGDTSVLSQVIGDNWRRVVRGALPGVQPSVLVFPIQDQSLTADKAIQFQWRQPMVNNPKHLPGAIFGMRRHFIEIERLGGGYYRPYLKKKVVMGTKKSYRSLKVCFDGDSFR